MLKSPNHIKFTQFVYYVESLTKIMAALTKKFVVIFCNIYVKDTIWNVTKTNKAKSKYINIYMYDVCYLGSFDLEVLNWKVSGIGPVFP